MGSRKSPVTINRNRRVLRAALFAAGLVAVVAVLPPLAQKLSREPTSERGVGGAAPGVPAVQTIQGIEPLRTAFNEDAGRVRLYLLLSPT
jgi:hypothetical protein